MVYTFCLILVSEERLFSPDSASPILRGFFHLFLVWEDAHSQNFGDHCMTLCQVIDLMFIDIPDALFQICPFLKFTLYVFTIFLILKQFSCIEDAGCSEKF